MNRTMSVLPVPSAKHLALIPQQQAMADQLGRGWGWQTNLRIVCRKCSGPVGYVIDPLVQTEAGWHYAVELGAILRAARYDAEQAMRWRESVSKWGNADGRHLNDSTIYHAFLEHSSAARLPDPLPFACERHGDRPGIRRSHLLTAVHAARDDRPSKPIRT